MTKTQETFYDLTLSNFLKIDRVNVILVHLCISLLIKQTLWLYRRAVSPFSMALLCSSSLSTLSKYFLFSSIILILISLSESVRFNLFLYLQFLYLTFLLRRESYFFVKSNSSIFKNGILSSQFSNTLNKE